MTYIANETNALLGMTIEQAYIPADEDSAKLLCNRGFLTKYDETSEPRPGRKVFLYEPKSFPANLLILKDGLFYLSKVVTSDTWVLSEYDLQ